MAGMQVMDKIASDEALYEVNGKQTGTCPAGAGKNHDIMLMSNQATPKRVTARLCDTITFMNHDGATYDIRFGTLGEPGMYAGESDITAYGHHNSPLRLTEPGTHDFYDAKYNKIKGSFTVTQ